MVALVAKSSGPLKFRVQWKLREGVVQQGRFECHSIQELSNMLYRAHGVTQASVDHIYVHQVNNTGAVFELIAIDGIGAKLNPHLLRESADGPEPSMIPVTPEPLPRQVTSNVVYVRFRAEQQPDDTLVVDGIFYGARKAPESSTRYLETKEGEVVL